MQSIRHQAVEVLVETQYLALSHLTEVVVAGEIPKKLGAQTGTHLVAVGKETLVALALLVGLMEIMVAMVMAAHHTLLVGVVVHRLRVLIA